MRNSSRACVVADDRHAFAELVRRHQSAVRALPAQADRRQPRAGRRPRAGDLRARVAQPEVVSAGGEVFDWLYRIATNCWLADARKRKEELLGDRDDAIADDERRRHAAPSTRCTATTRAPSSLKLDLERAMRVLSEAERAAIVQCYHNDLSHEEAAYVLGCPVGTVKTHVLRGKQKLKAGAGRMGVRERMATDDPIDANSTTAPGTQRRDRRRLARPRARRRRARPSRRLHRRRRLHGTRDGRAAGAGGGAGVAQARGARCGRIAAVGLALALPGAAVDVAREAFGCSAAKPVSLSGIAAVWRLRVSGPGPPPSTPGGGRRTGASARRELTRCSPGSNARLS